MAGLGEPVTDTYLRMLRFGPKRFNPSAGKRRALASVLGARPKDLPSGDGGRAALNELWRAKQVIECKEPSSREVSEWIQRHHGVVVTPRYIQQLRCGVADNPSAAIANALAAYFDVSVAYLLNGQTTDEPAHVPHNGATSAPAAPSEDEDEDEVRLIAMRLFGVSPQGRAFVASVIDDVRRRENLDAEPRPKAVE